MVLDDFPDSCEIEVSVAMGSDVPEADTLSENQSIGFEFRNWRGRDGNDPSVDIAKDADQRF